MDFSIVWMPKHTVMLGSNTVITRRNVNSGQLQNADSSVVNCAVFDKCWGFKRVKRCKTISDMFYAYVKPWQSLWPMALMVGSLNMTVLAESQIQVNAVEEKSGRCLLGLMLSCSDISGLHRRHWKHRQWHPSDHPSGFGMTNIDRSHIWSPIGFTWQGDIMHSVRGCCSLWHQKHR